MSKRRGDDESPNAQRHRRTVPADEPEEGELSDEPGPSTSSQARDKAVSDASDSPTGFAKIPLPFKSRNKADIRPPQDARSRVPRSYDRPSEHSTYSSSNGYDRWPPSERDRSYPEYRGTYSGYQEPDYRDARYDSTSRYTAADSYIPAYDSDAYDSRRSRPLEPYATDEGDYDRTKRRVDDPEPFAPRSPNIPGPHRLPKRPSPSPGRRRRDDYYRPRSPDVPSSAYGHSEPSSADYHRPRAFALPPRPPSPALSSSNITATLVDPSAPNTYLPQTDGKFKISVKPRNPSNVDQRTMVNHLELDTEASDPAPPTTEPPPLPPSQHIADSFLNGQPPPPTDEPPPIPPPLVPKLPAPPHPGMNGFSKPTSAPAEASARVEAPSKGVPVIKVTGTKIMRSPEAEMEAYGRTFVGVDKLADFELLNKLGEGTFGEVHKARRKTTGQMVALKRIIMKNETEGMPITALREIRILKQLKHPSIVSLVTMIVQRQQRAAETSIYMVFPYMEHDLSGLLENPNVKLSISQIKLYMLQLCEGVGYLHRNKILHRDLKSANLLINNEGSLQIADFGLARPVEFISRSTDSPDHFHRERRNYTNSVVTRWYRSPELLLGSRRYEGWVDMWGVGCIFAEMFQRKPVLPGTSDTDQLTKIFQLCGSPNEDNFPGWNRFDPKAEFVPFWAPMQRRIRSVLPEQASPETVDFLDRLLTLDPMRRMTAFEALDHDYFWTEPMPADPASLPRYDDSHEFNRRRAPQNAPQHAGVPMPISQMQQPGLPFFGQGPPPMQFFPPQSQPNGMGMGGYPAYPPPQNGRWHQQRGPGGALPNRPFPPNRQPPYNPNVNNNVAPNLPPTVILPPIHLVPGRPPPVMFGGGGGYPPPPSSLPIPPNPTAWQPGPGSRQVRERQDRERRSDWRDRPPSPPKSSGLNYG